ncbi:M20 family metallopeptidase [Candidatus Zixiibacteriota bacterium]
MSNSIKNKLTAAVAARQDAMTAFTRQLIELPTENPPGKYYQRCITFIGEELRKIGLEHDIINIPTPDSVAFPRYALSAFYGNGAKTLYFHGHYDVVPGASDEQFCPFVKDGKLYGRGSSDMKSGLAAMIYAIDALRQCDLELNGRIGLLIVPDEETGGALGSQYLADKGLLGKNGIGALTAEPTSGVIWNANRGALSLKIMVKGKSAHVCLQHQGVNAFEDMLTVARELAELKQEVEQHQTDYHVEPAEARRSILLLGGQNAGGTAFNTVPGECWFTVDRRINPEEDFNVEKQRLFDLFNRLKSDGVNLEVEILQEGQAAGTPEDDPLAQELARSITETTGRRPAFELCPGLLETRFYSRQGIPALGYGPGLLEVSHGPDEYVPLENIPACATIYALTAARLLHP